MASPHDRRAPAAKSPGTEPTVEKVLSTRAAVFGTSTGDVASIRRGDGKHRLMLLTGDLAVK